MANSIFEKALQLKYSSDNLDNYPQNKDDNHQKNNIELRVL